MAEDDAITKIHVSTGDDGLFRYEIEPGMVDEIRQATSGNYALGTKRFQSQVEAALGRRAVPGKPGRPRKEGRGSEMGDLFE